MELELIVEKRLSAQVVFVVHFFLFNIPPVKRMFCTWMASQDYEGISGIACELQIAAGKILSFISCCVTYRQLSVLWGSFCRLLPMIMSQVITSMWMQGFFVYENVCFPLVR